jgi:hypothetical protein
MALTLFKGSGGGAFWRGNNASGDTVNVPATTLLDPSTGSALDLNASAGDVIDVTPALDTALYAAGDSFFIPTAITGAISATGRVSLLQSLEIIDKSGTGPTLEICFYDSLVASFGAANAAMALSDADTLKELGYISVAATDWKTRANNKVLCLKNIGLELKAATGTDVYVAAYIPNGGTVGTFASSDFVLRHGVLRG